MSIYMLQNIETGLYYKRRGGWVERDKAAVWTSRAGPAAAKGSHWGGAWRTTTVIRTFKVEDDTNDQ